MPPLAHVVDRNYEVGILGLCPDSDGHIGLGEYKKSSSKEKLIHEDAVALLPLKEELLAVKQTEVATCIGRYGTFLCEGTSSESLFFNSGLRSKEHSIYIPTSQLLKHGGMTAHIADVIQALKQGELEQYETNAIDLKYLAAVKRNR